MIGIVLVLVGAFFDSLAGSKQIGIREEFKPSAYQLMFFTCFWVTIFSLVIGK
jgi:hypothetical protein